MGLNPLPTQSCAPLSELRLQYDQHRFFDAWQSCAALWTTATNVDQLSAEELVFAGRLAIRLGGPRLSRSLLWKARRREPAHPLVRYFTNHLQEPRTLLLDELAAFEANPDLGGEDDELRANWLASHAYSWAKLRNHKRAMELLQQAHALSPDNAWIHSMQADAHGFADDWRSSLQSAERAWDLDQRSAWAGTSLAAALLNLGQIDEAVRRLALATEDTQSAQLLQTACWYQCAIAEVLEGNERADAIQNARALAMRIEPLSPLADREFKNGLARTWLDIADLSGDNAETERWAQEARSPFHRQMLANLKANPNGRRIALPYRRAIQKHAECLPTSVGSALSATGIPISVEELAADVTFGGTAEWAAADWLRGKGLHVRMFSATADTAAKLIEAGIGFVVSWDDDEMGHAVAIVGIDYAAGVAIAHDPMSFRGTEYLLRVFEQRVGPIGVLSMAAVTPERARQLDDILPEDSAVVEAAQEHHKALDLYGPSAAGDVLAAIAARFPTHAGTRFLEAIQNLEEGRTGLALAGFRDLLAQFPNAPMVRVRVMQACRAMGDSALLRQTLRTIVETGSIPGVDAQSDWIRPHPRYICEYADMLRLSSETRRDAEILLRSVLSRSWGSAGAWHTLADLRWQDRNTPSALLAYSIASFLAPHNEHYARAYVDVLSQTHRTQEGLQWLEDRAHRMGISALGVSTWITWISVLEDRGYPEHAIAACESALAQHGSAIMLLAFSVSFLARMGRWQEAEESLRRLEQTDAKGAFHEAAVGFNRMCGNTANALEHAEAWVTENPRSIPARYALLDLLECRQGQAAAAERALAWMHEHPANEDFEQAFCQHAKNRFNWRRLRILRRRVERNREDGWAWRELAFSTIAAFEAADEARQARLRPRIEEYLAQADRVSHDDTATIRAHGLWHEAQGEWRKAVDRFLQTIRYEPENFYAYRHAWECSARLPEDEMRDLWATIEPLYLDNSCHLPNSLEMMRLLAARFGARAAEKIVEGWRLRRPDDPNVLEAAADLLLDRGHGRSDAMRALDLLRAAAERFPYHSGLRFSLAQACRATGDSAGAKLTFEELVRRQPGNISALAQLAWIQLRNGDTDLAFETIERLRTQQPQEAGYFDTRAQMLIECDRHDEAEEVLNDGLKELPFSVRMVERAIALFPQCGDEGQAVQAARAGVRAFPQGAYLWMLLSDTLRESPGDAAPGEVEACLRKSLRWNRGLFDAADRLAMLLAEQRHYKQAMDLLHETGRRMTDPSPVLGRIAWIRRQSGEKQEAVTDLAADLRNAPWYAWGWNLLLTWLEADKNWDLCRQLLGAVPAQMLTDMDFRQKRLMLLEKSKAAPSSTEAEWNELLADFPEVVNIHLRRFDSLIEAGRPEDAAAVLRRVASLAMEDVFFLARLVDVECREGKYQDALKHALTVCFALTEQSPWPVNQVWDQMRKAGMARELAEAFFARLQQASRPTRRALMRYAEHILDQKMNPRVPKWIRHSSLSYSTRQIGKLTHLVEQSSWADSNYVADLLTVLNKHGYWRLVLSCWNRMSAKGLQSNSAAWAQAGLAMVNLGKKPAARKLMHDWRTRPGVAMWMLANYLLCLSRLRRNDLKEVVITCRDALNGLPHDHCACYLAYMEVEACALLDDKNAMIAAWDKNTRYLNGIPEKGEFFPQAQRYLARRLPVAVRLAKQHDDSGFRRIRWELGLKRFWNQQIRIRGKRLLILLLRIAILLWFAGLALAPLFR